MDIIPVSATSSISDYFKKKKDVDISLQDISYSIKQPDHNTMLAVCQSDFIYLAKRNLLLMEKIRFLPFCCRMDTRVDIYGYVFTLFCFGHGLSIFSSSVDNLHSILKYLYSFLFIAVQLRFG